MFKRVKLIILITILVMAGIVLISFLGNLQKQKQDEAALEIPKTPNKTADIFGKEIRFVEDRNGKKIWELEADSVEQYLEQDVVLLKDVRITYYAKDGRTFHLTGDKGKYNQMTRDAEIEDNVLLTMSDGYRLKTHAASYNNAKRIITSSDPVEIDGEQIRLTGKGMLVNVDEQTFKILSKVDTKLKPGKKR